MRDQHQRQPAVLPELLQQGDDVVPGVLVQVPGRLVGQQHLRLLDQRPGDRDPLLLAAGQLGRQVPGPVGQADVREGLRGPGPPARRAHAERHQGRLHVLLRAQRRHQVERLEDEADGLGPDPRDLRLPELREINAARSRRT